MASMVVLLIKPNDLGNIWVILSFLLLYIGVILTVYSMWLYLVAAYHSLKDEL
jgi:phosphatidylglycerophosphate synthase